MKIAIDAREFSKPQFGGFNTYVKGLLHGLAETDVENEYIIYTDRPDLPPDSRLPQKSRIRVINGHRLIADNISLNKALREDRPDFIHFPANTAAPRCPVPYLLTLHDTLSMERSFAEIAASGNYYKQAMNLYFKYAPFSAARNAKRIVTVSNFARDEICRLLKMNLDDIDVIPPSIDPRFTPTPDADFRNEILDSLGVSRFCLVIGSVERRKNLARTLLAFIEASKNDPGLGMVLTWPGNIDFNIWSNKNIGRELSRTRIMKSVTTEELVKLYSSANLFLFMSTGEGFGLPVVEAMSCGCPVLTSSTSCLPETAGDAALLADPTDISGIARGIERITSDPLLRKELAEKGFIRSRDFTTEKMGNLFEKEYKKVFLE